MGTNWTLNGVPWASEPWLPYLATEYIRHIKPLTVFEWGMGGSTVFFLKQRVIKLMSVEHKSDWYEEVCSKLMQVPKADTVISAHLIPYEDGEIGPDKSDPTHYKSGSTELGAVNFKQYASFIDQFEQFDLVLVDGMARPSCIVHAIQHVKYSGWLVVDNTGDRPYYLEKTLHLIDGWERGWERVDIQGYGPTLDYKWTTTFFHNVRKDG